MYKNVDMFRIVLRPLVPRVLKMFELCVELSKYRKCTNALRKKYIDFFFVCVLHVPGCSMQTQSFSKNTREGTPLTKTQGKESKKSMRKRKKV